MLLEKIRNRTVALILPAHSVSELERRKDEFKKFDWCWCGINQFWLLEHIFKMEMAIVLCPNTAKTFWNKYCEFAKRGLLISDLPFKYKYHYSFGGPKDLNTLFAFLWLMIRKKVKRVVIFGADGFNDKGVTSKEEYYVDWKPLTQREHDFHRTATRYFNEWFPDDTGDTEIINCSPDSYYKLKKVTYDELLRMQK